MPSTGKRHKRKKPTDPGRNAPAGENGGTRTRDGKYFLSAPKVRAIFKIAIASQRPEKVASLSDLWKPLEEVTWMALAPDGSPALSANGASDEIFAYAWEAP